MDELRAALVGGAELRLDELVVAEEDTPSVAVGALQIAVCVADVEGNRVVRGEEEQRQFGVVALLRTAAVERHDEDVFGPRGFVHVVDVAQILVEIVGVVVVADDLSGPVCGAVVHDLRFTPRLGVAVYVVLLRGGDRQVGLGHERFGGDLVGAAKDLVDPKQRVGAGQVAQDQIVELVETRGHGRGGQGEFVHHLRLDGDQTEGSDQIEVVPGPQEKGFAKDPVPGRIADCGAVLHVVDDRIGAVDGDVAVLEVVSQLFGLASGDPVLQLIDVAGLIAFRGHGFGGDVADVEDAARILEERQGVVGVEQPRFGIGFGLVEVVVGVESVGLFLQAAGRQCAAQGKDIKNLFHGCQFRISDPDRWCIFSVGDIRPSRCLRRRPRDHILRSW